LECHSLSLLGAGWWHISFSFRKNFFQIRKMLLLSFRGKRRRRRKRREREETS
jgi:hypothetical protein